jgi:glycosidase
MLSFWNAVRKLLNKPPKLEWWQDGIIYHIYVKSFYDSNNDGIGDLQGIIQKLDYIKSAGFKSIWLSPIYPSGGKDGGYDVTSFVDIDPAYGTMKDFDSLVEKVHQKGLLYQITNKN